MPKQQTYLSSQHEPSIAEVLAAIDKDVERGEDALMLGLGLVMLSSIFAPIAPPTVLLPLVALTFAMSASYARINYQNMERKLTAALPQLNSQERLLLGPVARVFVDYSEGSLADSFNPFKNLWRTWKSVMGGILINPFWMPIFYVMGIQIIEERNLGYLNQAIIGVEQKIAPVANDETE